MIKDFIKYRKGVLEGYKNLGYSKPGDICIIIRYLLNDIIRYYSCKLTIWDTIVNKNKSLLKKIEKYEKERREEK